MIPQKDVPTAAIEATHRHYKGGWYKVLFRAKHTETGETVIVYQHIYPHARAYFVRPELLFFGKLPDGRDRFEAIGPRVDQQQVGG